MGAPPPPLSSTPPPPPPLITTLYLAAAVATLGVANADLLNYLTSVKNVSVAAKLGAVVNATLAAKNATPLALPLEVKESVDYAVTSKLYSLPKFDQAVNFMQIPERGIVMNNFSVTLRGVKDVEWYYLYPNIGNGYMPTLQWVNRMTSKYLATGGVASLREFFWWREGGTPPPRDWLI